MPGEAVEPEPEDCESGPTSTRLAWPDNSQTQREAIRGNRAAFSTNVTAQAMHSFALNTKLNV